MSVNMVSTNLYIISMFLSPVNIQQMVMRQHRTFSTAGSPCVTKERLKLEGLGLMLDNIVPQFHCTNTSQHNFLHLSVLVREISLPYVVQEHEKRCWSVDFNRMDPKILASGSDDTKGWLSKIFHISLC